MAIPITKPTVGGSAGQWGAELNTALDALAAGTGPPPGTADGAIATSQAGATVWQSGNYATAALPTYARGLGLINRYDPARHVYNAKASNSRMIQKGLAAALAGTGLCHDVFIGASDLVFNGSTVDPLHMWPEIEAAQLALVGYPRGGTGLQPCADTLGLDAAWASSHGAGWTNYGAFYGTASAGATYTFFADQDGTGVDLWVDDTSATGFTIQVGAGTAVAQTTTGTSAIRKFSVAGAVTKASTLITVTATGKLVPFFKQITTASGYVKHNVARSSSGATQGGSTGLIAGATGSWQPASGSYLNIGQQTYTCLPATPHRVTIELGANDLVPTTTQTPATAVAGIANIAALFPNSDIRLVVPWHYGQVDLAVWQSFAGKLYQLADTLDCQLIDWFDRLGTYAQMTANGVLGADGYHVNVGSNAVFGRAAAQADAA